MAFNPFHAFRKYRTPIFAVLTIICMGVFTLSFAGSPFSGNAMFGGAPANSGKEVTAFNYRTNWFSSQTRIWETTVEKEFRQRRLANEFILYAISRGTTDAMEAIAPSGPANATKGHYPPLLEPYIRNRSTRQSMMDLVRRNPSFAQFLAPPAQRINEITRDIEQIARAVQSRENLSKEGDAEDFDKAATTLVAALRFELWLTEQEALYPQRTDKSPVLYFGGYLNLDETLDFMLWRHEADKLGVSYDETTVKKGVNRMIGVGDTMSLTNSFIDNSLVQDFIRSRSRRGSSDPISTAEANDLLKALTDEFRVQTAKEALLGEPSNATLLTASGIFQPTEAVTPDEFLQFFREKRTTLNTAFLTVPVSYFIDPDKKYSEETLLELFERYRSALPAPDRAEPAFKVPRKVRIEYATGDPSSPYYKEAGKLLMLHPTVLRHSIFASTYNAGGGVGGWLGVVGAPLLDEPFYKNYERYQFEMEDEVRHKQAVSPAVFDKHYQAAVTVGEILGSLQQAGPLAIPTEFAGSAALDDAAIAQAVGATVLGATSPSPVTLAMLPYPYSNTVQKLSEIESSLVADSEKTLGEQQLRENLDTLRKELEKLSTTPDKAKQYLEKTTRELGLQINGMSEAKDRYGIVDDPAMKAFKDEYEYQKTLRPNEPLMPLADILMQINGVYRPRVWTTTNPRASYVFWLAEDKPAHELPFNEARPQVLAAAQLRDARTLALEFVKKFTGTELKGRSWPEDAKIRAKEMKSFLESQKLGVAQKPGRVFQLDNISRLWTPEMVANQTSGERVYFAYAPPESDIPFPPANFVDRVMTMQQPGDSVFLRDRPERTFYVSVLIERSVPTLEDFRKIYASIDGIGQRDPLWEMFTRERRAQFRKEFIRRMREEATGELDEEGRIKVPAEIRQKFDKSDAG